MRADGLVTGLFVLRTTIAACRVLHLLYSAVGADCFVLQGLGTADDHPMSMNDDFLFQDEVAERPAVTGPTARPWLILIVDDDPEVHAMTRLVMKKFSFHNRPIQFLSAYSAEEAMNVLRADPGIAMVLLDVVMETDDAGLRLVPRIREELNNDAVRIILRTGQPGQAPEDAVIHGYDINDYKAKTELTAQKLGTATVAALRSYEHITELQRSRKGMERIVEASTNLFRLQALERFAEAALQELARVLDVARDGFVCVPRGATRQDAQILTAHGRYAGAAGLPVSSTIEPVLGQKVMSALRDGPNYYDDDVAVLRMLTKDERNVAVVLHTGRPLDDLEQRLAEVLGSKIGVGFDNLHLYDQLKKAHKATVVALAGLAEYKDPDGAGGDHVLRLSRIVTETAFILRSDAAYAERVDDEFLDLITMGSMLYDIGMVGVPDRILTKAGPLDADERRLMESHCERGAAILEKASRTVEGSNYLSFGAVIARGHQERWDGSGYPLGLTGEAIPLSARIVAVCDVFDALTHRRSWRDAVPRADALKVIEEGAGTLFDPAVVQAFFKVMNARGRLRG
jgi:response regulator RpfG family c-di-GMP phosphodiesterase